MEAKERTENQGSTLGIKAMKRKKRRPPLRLSDQVFHIAKELLSHLLYHRVLGMGFDEGRKPQGSRDLFGPFEKGKFVCMITTLCSWPMPDKDLSTVRRHVQGENYTAKINGRR